MSNNAAIRRRAGTATPNPVGQVQRNFQSNMVSNDPRGPVQQAPSVSNNQGLTLQQVITLIDGRLVALETSSKNTQNTLKDLQQNGIASAAQNTNTTDEVELDISSMVDERLNEYFSEFNTRTELLATEITNLKEIVLKLQSYTLEINKTLMEERIRILSDIPRKESGNDSLMNPITTEEVNLEDLAAKNLVISEDDETLYDEDGLLENTLEEDLAAATVSENEDLQDKQLLNKKRQRGGANNKKSFKLAV